jgi:hypothetical protein
MVRAGSYAHSFSFLTLAKIPGYFVSNPSLPHLLEMNMVTNVFQYGAGIAQSAQNLAMGWTVQGSNPGRGEIFRTRPDQPWGPPSLRGIFRR